ncbi:MAG: hypothetical protein WAU39_09215, partial [Polyangiales bacterium]
TGGGGGTGGSGNTGGLPEGACTDAADQAAYDALTYTDPDGVTYTGVAAASAIGSDCIFGAPTGNPSLAGCTDEATAVLGCFPNCDSGTINTLADCVAQCTQDATGLSDQCVGCTGDTVACGAAFCTTSCVSDTNSPECIGCRCDNDCILSYDECSGLVPTTTCP